jgi:flagellar basal body-associated protein FliL
VDKEKKEQENTKSEGPVLNALETEELDMFEELNVSESTDKAGHEDHLPPNDEKEIKTDAPPEKSLAEDELWDSGDKIDNVPLFEEFASELLEHDEKKGGPPSEPDIQPEIQPDNLVTDVPFETEYETEASSPLTQESDSTKPHVSAEEEISEGPKEGIKQIEIGAGNPWFLWGLITIALALIATGGVAVWKMTGTILNPSAKSGILQDKIETDENAKYLQLSGNKKPDSAARQPSEPQKTPDISKITLAPFLIPARQNGEMVFFNLQVELLARDQKTMDALMQKEVWIRDIIYRELKDIDISKGMQGNLLTQYQKPIVDHINTELTPLRVEDVRLSGSLIK